MMNIETERERIKESDQLSERDRELLLEADEKLKSELPDPEGDYHVNVLRAVKLITEDVNGLERLLLDWEDIEQPPSERQREAEEAAREFVTQIKTNYSNGHTRDNFIARLRRFISLFSKWEWIPQADEILTSSHGPKDPSPAPGSILWWKEEVYRMIQEAPNLRDKALIATQFSSGGRPQSEIHKLNIGDINIHENRIVLTVPEDAKTGTRDVTMFIGAPYLQKWYENHWGREYDAFGPETPLWPRTPRFGDPATQRMGYKNYHDRIKRAGNKANLEKPYQPRHFRRSRASIMAMYPTTNQRDLEIFFGWARGSDAPQHYIARFSGETMEKIGAAEGMEIDSEEFTPPEMAPVNCPQCGEYTPSHRDDCIWCPARFDPDEVESVSEADGDEAIKRSDRFKNTRDDVVKMVTSGDLTAEDIQTAKDLERAIREFPDLLDEMDELRTLLNSAEDDEGQSSDSSGIFG